MPEQAALRLNNATRAKTISGLLTQGHESYPDNSSLVKMPINLLLQITI
jgi:NCK-associated protein 1